MSILKILIAFAVAAILSAAVAFPALAVDYNVGVTVGQYVKYGNFISSGPGFEAFGEYDWLQLTVTAILGKEVLLLSTGQFRNGSALPGNGTSEVWNVEEGTQSNIPSTQGPIIAANLNQGDIIPPPNTYSVNRTEQRTYLGVTRDVNILIASVSTPAYNSTSTYVYDRSSGMLLEASSQTVAQGDPEPITSTYSYSVMETNIFSSTTPTPSQSVTPTPTFTVQPSATPSASTWPTTTPTSSKGIPTELLIIAAAAIAIVIVVAIVLALRKRSTK